MRSALGGAIIVVILATEGLLFGAPMARGWVSERVPRSRLGLLVNPGFEAGAEGWQVYPSTATFEIVSAPTHGGARAASLTKVASRGRAFIYQDVSVTAGGRYIVQTWAVWNDERLSNVKLRIEWLSESGATVGERDEISLDERRPTYQLLQLEGLEAPQGAVIARIQGYTFVNQAGPAQPALFDDFLFAPADTSMATPAPTSTRTPTALSPSPTPSLTLTPSPVPAGAVVINEVFYDPPTAGGDPDDEWVELYNTTAHAISLEHWRLADHISQDVLPAVDLPPHGFVVVAASASFRSLYPWYDGLLIVLDSPIGNGLNNNGDSLWLRDERGRAVDAVSYGEDTGAMFPAVPAVPEGYSLERVPAGHDTDTAGDWFPRSMPSPGYGIDIRRLYLPLVATFRPSCNAVCRLQTLTRNLQPVTRQDESERTAFAGFALQLDASVVLLSQPLGNR